MKSKVIVIALILGIMLAFVACKSGKNEPESTQQTIAETTTEESKESISETTIDPEDIEDPEEIFSDAPDIILPSEGESIETMQPEETGEIDIGENSGGSF